MSQSQVGRALRQFTLSNGKSAGRNSSGHITIFHRGGGSKRLQRRVDLKRSTSSIGIVERVEYDPNRSSRIALVRWTEGVKPQIHRQMIEEFAPPSKIFEPTTTSIRGLFSFSFLPQKEDQRKEACFSPALKVSLPSGMPPWLKIPLTTTSGSKGEGIKRKITCAKDVLYSAFSSPKAKGEIASLSSSSSFGFPRIAVAGAKPAFYAPRIREKVGESTPSICNIQKLGKHSSFWEHRIKRKAALSWQSFRPQDTLGLLGAAEHQESKLNKDQGLLPTKPKHGAYKVERAPVTYIIASHSLEAGKMVMNCDWSKPSTSN